MSVAQSGPAERLCVFTAVNRQYKPSAGYIPHRLVAIAGLDFDCCTPVGCVEGCAMVERTTVTDKDIYQRQRELQNRGWDWETRNYHAVNPHSSYETLRHYLVKAVICNRIANRPGRFVTEAEHPGRGQADIIDLRASEPAAVIIEVETDCTRERHLQKCEQYMGPCIRDVFVVDPTEAPSDVDEWTGWLDGELP